MKLLKNIREAYLNGKKQRELSKRLSGMIAFGPKCSEFKHVGFDDPILIEPFILKQIDEVTRERNQLIEAFVKYDFFEGLAYFFGQRGQRVCTISNGYMNHRLNLQPNQ